MQANEITLGGLIAEGYDAASLFGLDGGPAARWVAHAVTGVLLEGRNGRAVAALGIKPAQPRRTPGVSSAARWRRSSARARPAALASPQLPHTCESVSHGG